ncbi:MAG: hypothetical protein GXX96_03565 [Planctomycetaceae bacterium]|nr:hypothetical protein [Planctomycetaceae bacterium]
MDSTPSKRSRRRSTKKSPGFDFTERMRLLCHDMTRRVPELSHIDFHRVAVSFCQTRKSVKHGMYASLTPMRFPGGELSVVRGGRNWGIQRLQDNVGREMLYILSFYLPRFLDLEFREKLTTIVHELWHISPRFNGDVRRFRGRCYAHSGSQKSFDAVAERLADDWLSRKPPAELYDFLHHGYRKLSELHGAVYGTKIPAPKLYPILKSEAVRREGHLGH